MTGTAPVAAVEANRARTGRRVREFAACLAEGMTHGEAAAAVGIAPATARAYALRAAAGDFGPDQPSGPDVIPSRARDRDALFESLTGPAMNLAWLVREGNPGEGAELIGGLSAAEREVLPFVLAALVDVERTKDQLLAWARPCAVSGERVADCTHCMPRAAVYRTWDTAAPAAVRPGRGRVA